MLTSIVKLKYQTTSFFLFVQHSSDDYPVTALQHITVGLQPEETEDDLFAIVMKTICNLAVW
jgi:hypothetical protein